MHVALMDRLTTPDNLTGRHGLGLIAKTPAVNFRRGNMLSRDIGYINGKVIVLRGLVKTILTGSMRSRKITTD